MVATPAKAAVDWLRLVLPREAGWQPDGELLVRFAASRDEAAFAELVRRHGPMVLGVCRHLTRDEHDAEDAFQAAFLVLARQAGRLRCRGVLAGYLHGVALRTALPTRQTATRRRGKERPLEETPAPEGEDGPARREALAALDGELAALPEQLRAAVILCELQARPRRDAAGALGVPEGTLSSRLAAARRRLAG